MEGAKAFALPLSQGQYLSWKKVRDRHLLWNAIKPEGSWFQVKFSLPGLKILSTTDEPLAKRLLKILRKTRSLNRDFMRDEGGYEVETILEFEPEYGFGSSSTLISNIACWADVDPYELQKSTFGGSGYDIACARSKKPLFYSLRDGMPEVEQVEFDPPFKDHVYFVYLGNKQVSKESIKAFRRSKTHSQKEIDAVSQISRRIVAAKGLNEFEKLLDEHEDIMASVLKLPKVKSLYFDDHQGTVKSLGAWGGDFVLMTFHGNPETFESYLKEKGFRTFYKYADIVLKYKK